MALNKVALIRYKTINACLRDKQKKYSLENLIEACAVALKLQGIDKGVSKRTTQADLQLMRSKEFGYGAPIKVIDKKYYTYADEDFSITNQVISMQDFGMLTEAIEFMEELQSFKHFNNFEDVVEKLKSIKLEQKSLINVEQFKETGTQVINEIYSIEAINSITSIIENIFYTRMINENGEPLKILPSKNLYQLLFNEGLQGVIRSIDGQANLIFARYYNKAPQANWFTVLHQNLTIPVKEKLPVEGFTGWSKKDGITSVMAPSGLLQNLFSIFIYLEDIDESSGALKIVPGSHHKILSIQERNALSENSLAKICPVPRGGVHIIKPLLLQGFSKLKAFKKSSFIQLDFCSIELPGGLQWY